MPPKNTSVEPRLTESLEDYLEAIAELIAKEGHAHTKDIAEKLNVKMPSVTGAIRQLQKLKYITYNSHYPVQLTPEGKAIADDVIHRHTILKAFFSEVLGLSIDKASENACHIEHIVDSDTIRRFVLFSEAIRNRCDAQKLRTYLSEAMSMLELPENDTLKLLTDFSSGDKVTIQKIGRNLNGIDGIGLAVGDVVTFDGKTLDKTSLRIHKDGRQLEIPLQYAENIWAKPEA